MDEVLRMLARMQAQMDRIEGKLDALFAVRSVQAEKDSAKLIGVAETLTPKQHAVLQMMALDMNEREMAEVMGVSRNTLKLHKQAVLVKLDMRDVKEPRARLVRWFDDVCALLGEVEYRRVSGGLSRTWASGRAQGDALPEVLMRTK